MLEALANPICHNPLKQIFLLTGQDSHQQDPIKGFCLCLQLFLLVGFSSQVFPPAISFSSLGQLLPEPQMFNVSWRQQTQEIASQGGNRN